MFFCHPMVVPEAIEARKYQMSILETALKANTLCVLPTGMGKTPLAIMLAAERLEIKDSKILIVAPTRPLCAQHEKSFREKLDIPKKQVALLTGQIPSQNRYWYYKNLRVISATPQTIQNDLRSGVLNLKYFSLLIVDEVHRAVRGYAYPYVAKKYMEQARDPRVLGLTASPGGSQERIEEICNNLFVDKVEIRTEGDKDIKEYVKETNVEVVKVSLSKNIEEIQQRLKSLLNNKLSKLRSQDIRAYSRKDLLDAQRKFSGLLKTDKRPIYFHIISWIAEAIKIWHAVQLVETQSLYALGKYFERLAEKKDKSSQRVIAHLGDVIERLPTMEEHPKITMLKILVREELKKNPNVKIIIFSHFRDNIDKIKHDLSQLENCQPAILIGQAGERGLKQREQIDLIKDYEADVYNVLIGSSVSEEGLNLVGSDIAIFYEPISSEVRSIQRRGRVGRFKAGKVIILVTRKTSDESKYYLSQKKEKTMKRVLNEMRHGKGLERWLK
jgi:ERCC4-related helicase